MNDIRFGDGTNDIEAEAAAAALAAYQQSIREQTTEQMTDRQDLVWGLLAGLMHYGDRTDADFTQALADAAREHAEVRREEPFYVGAVVDDGERLGVITGVNRETPEDFSYKVRFLRDGDIGIRVSGEIALADPPAIQLGRYKVHTFARAQEELSQLEAAITLAAESGRAPAPRDVRDRDLLLAGVSEWARVPASELMSQLRPQIEERTAQLRGDAAATPSRALPGEAAELAHDDFPGERPTSQPRTGADPSVPAPVAGGPLSAPGVSAAVPPTSGVVPATPPRPHGPTDPPAAKRSPRP